MKNREILPQQNNINPLMSFSPQYLKYSAMRAHVKSQTAPPPTQALAPMQSPRPVKKMRWGEPTWFAFHTLAEKVKEESFPIIRQELLNIINTICNNLPCPECAKHATIYMNSINFNSIQTKEQLKIMLFNFHNEVNRKKGFPIFEYEELQPKYSKANTIAILQNFMGHFEDKTSSFKLIADQLYRARLCTHIKNWIKNNLSHFYM